MTHQHVSRTNQQSKSDTPLVSGILQRAAVRNVPEKDVQPTQEEEATTFRESRFHHNFCQVPASTGEMPRIQPKLKIGAVGDRYEQEADKVAQNVVQRINAPAPERGDEDEVMRKAQEGSLQREEIPEEEDELRMKPIVQRLSAEGGMAAPPDLESSIQRARGGGQPLADSVREPMERAFGANFSGVRVHADAQSDALNQSIQAKAFTTGQDVFFRSGAYELGSRGGQELLAHELTHVVQQNGGVVQRTSIFNLTSELRRTEVVQRTISVGTERFEELMPIVEGLVQVNFPYNHDTDRAILANFNERNLKFQNFPALVRAIIRARHVNEIRRISEDPFNEKDPANYKEASPIFNKNAKLHKKILDHTEAKKAGFTDLVHFGTNKSLPNVAGIAAKPHARTKYGGTELSWKNTQKWISLIDSDKAIKEATKQVRKGVNNANISIARLEVALKKRELVYFHLNQFDQEMITALKADNADYKTKTGFQPVLSVTGQEFIHIYKNWKRFSNSVVFLRNLKPVMPPW